MPPKWGSQSCNVIIAGICIISSLSSKGCYRYVFLCWHIGSKSCDMSMHYRQFTDTFSILNYLQNHCLWRKKWSKVGDLLSRKFQITYKIIVCGEKTVKIGTILSRKLSKDPSWLAMCNVNFRNELLTGLPAHLMPFSIRVTTFRYKLVVIFTCRLCIDIAMSNRHVESFCEYSDNRYFWQSITALLFSSMEFWGIYRGYRMKRTEHF